MYNYNDTAILQRIRYKSDVFNIYNRNYMCSDGNPLGYTKELISFPEVDRQYNNLILSSQKNKRYYNLSWELYTTIEEFEKLMNIWGKYTSDLREELDSSYDIYTPSVSIIDNLYLEDNRIKDCISNKYEVYILNIKSVEVQEYFFNVGTIKFVFEGETL